MINAMTGQALADGLSALTAEMSGQTLNDAYTQRMTGSYDLDGGPTIGVGNWTSSTPAISGDTDNSVVDSTEQVAVDAWHDYVENEVAIVSDVTGGIVSGSDVDTLNYAILEDSNDNLKAVTPVGIPMAQATVAVAQALGVSVDWEQVSDDMKTGFNNALTAAGAVYDKAKDLVAAWWDGVNILFPKRTVEAIEDYFNEEGIGAGEKSASYPALITGAMKTCFWAGVTAWYRTEGSVIAVYLVSNTSGVTIPVYNRNGTVWFTARLTSIDAYDGRTAYYWSNTYNISDAQNERSGFYHGYPGDNPVTRAAGASAHYAWVCAYGNITETGFPDGTEGSEAPSYTPSTIPSPGGIATSPTTTEPVVIINLPATPLDTTESTVDPASPTDDDTVSDLPAPPIPLPIPDTRPSNPDVPLVNPSVVDSTLVDTLVEELAETLDPQPPQPSGVIPVPLLPGIPDGQGGSSYPSIVPSSGSGLIHVYNPTPAEMASFGAWLWVTYSDATIDKIWNNPFDGIIGAHELYATPQTDGSDNIRSGFLVCPTTAALVRQRYTEINCGTIIVPEFYGNYLDYSPYSQAYIYLPFIGINEVSIDDIAGHAINIRYRIDAYNGSCIAMIFVAKDGYQNLCYQFAGNCAVEVPLAGGSQAAIKAGMMQAEAYARAAQTSAVGHLFGGIGSALMGSLGGVISSISGIAGDYANAKAGVEAARVANKSSVQHSGSFGASHGAMGNKIPFIIIRNPIQVKVVNYNDEYGFPAHKRVIVGGCSGYLRVREVNVISAHATDEEKTLIEVLLKNGVYVS